MDEVFSLEIITIIITAIPAAICLITIFVKLFGFFRNVFSDEAEYEATVLKKVHNTEYRNNRVSKSYNIPYRVEIYFITFRTPKHKKLRLKVDNKDYYAVKEGDTGTLTLQGSKFISFEKKCTLPTDSEWATFN